LADRSHDHRNGRSSVFGCERRRRSSRHNDIDLGSNQFGRKLRETRRAAFNGSILNDVALTLDVTEVAQAIPEGSQVGSVESRSEGPEHADAPQLPLLRARSNRRHRRAADQRDELASPHGALKPRTTPYHILEWEIVRHSKIGRSTSAVGQQRRSTARSQYV